MAIEHLIKGESGDNWIAKVNNNFDEINNSDIKTEIQTARNGEIDLDTRLEGDKTELSNKIGDLTTSTNTNNASVVDITNEINTQLSEKANDTDSARTTTSKTVTGAINELDSDIGGINTQLSDNIDRIKTQTLYNCATQEISSTIFKLQNCKNAIINNTLKIAFVGDSITEGANNFYKDVYIMRIISELKKLLPSVAITYTNFALGGRTLLNFADSNYKATNPETNISTNFWRSWATVGKSWADSVKDYNANLIVLAFGMNDGGVVYDSQFYSMLNGVVNYIKGTSSDICLVSNILSSETWNQDKEILMSLARVQKEYSIDNGYGLLDANRLWKILLYGKEEEKFYNKMLTSITDINLEKSYNFNATITFTNNNFPTIGSCDITIRKYETKYFILRFGYFGGANIVQLYSIGNGTPLNTWTITGKIVYIDIEGSKITINNTTFITYENMYQGDLNFAPLDGYISSIQFINRINYEYKPLYSEIDLIGEKNQPTGKDFNGDGIHHPTSLGHYLAYYMASQGLINSLTKYL